MKHQAIKRPEIAAGGQGVTGWANQLMADGYCVIPDVIDCAKVDSLAADLGPVFDATPRSIGPFYGDGTVRIGGLLTQSEHTAAFVQHPLILGIMDKVLKPWCDSYQLNLTQGIEILPGSGAQPPHRDQDMWGGPKGLVEYLVNVMWPFTPYRADNGATIIWPGTHQAQDMTLLPEEEPIYGEADPGSAILFLGSVQHSGGANRTDLPRRGMIISYSLGWLKPYELQTLVYPPEVAKTFPRELAELVGYRMHRPNLGNVGGVCPSTLLNDRTGAAPTPATDYLKPEHEMLINMWRDDMLGVGA